MKLGITRRPIQLETQAPAAVILAGLAKIAEAEGRAALYGVTDPLEAKLFASTSREADFAGGVYRDGLVLGSVPGFMPGWSFTRAGAAFAPTGLSSLKSYASGEPRLDTQGLFVERQDTNLLRYGSEFDNAAWTKAVGLAGSAPVVTANHGTAPDGTTTADRIQFATAGTLSGDDQSYITQQVAGTGAQMGSVWMRSTSGASQTLYIRAGSGVDTVITVTGQWQKFWISATTGDRKLVFGLRGNVTGAVAAADVLAWGGGLTASAFRTSTVLTTSASATRAADATSWDETPSASGGIFVEADLPLLPGAANTLVGWDNGSTNNYLAIFFNGSAIRADLWQGDQNVATVVRSGFTGGQRVRVCIGWDANRLYGAFNGVEAASVPFPQGLAFTKVRPGQSAFGEHLDCHVRRVATLRRFPSAAQRIAMTEA